MSDCSSLLREHLPALRSAASRGPILDLACGGGRNGLYLVENSIPVVFADIDPGTLQRIEQRLDASPEFYDRALVELWTVDFEWRDPDALAARRFGGMLVFRYLHRPLMDKIRQAIQPGGLIVYETFTVDQAQYGRPTNPDYLLRHGELASYFPDWRILYSFEGTTAADGGSKPSAIAQLIAVKPEV